MELQADIIELIEKFSPNKKDLIINYIKGIENKRVPKTSANNILMSEIEKIAAEELNNDN